jgi:hypothetical protein
VDPGGAVGLAVLVHIVVSGWVGGWVGGWGGVGWSRESEKRQCVRG